MMINHRFDGPEGAPVVVLLHSVGTDLTMWDGLCASLSQRFHVLRCDTRGHGASSAPTGPYSIADLAGDVLDLATSLGIERFDLCGLSMGGQIGMWMALNAPERLQRLVIANTAARLGTRELWDGRIGAVKRAGMAAIVDGAIDRFFGTTFRSRQPAVVARIRAVFLATQPAGYIGSCAAIRDFDVREALARIRVPTLVIGGNSDEATPPMDAKSLAENIPGAKLVMIPAAHLSNLEAPELFDAAVHSFLR